VTYKLHSISNLTITRPDSTGRFYSQAFNEVAETLGYKFAALMDNKRIEALRLTWDLAQRQNKLIGRFLPVVKEVGDLLSEGRTPTDEQIRTWRSLHTQMTTEIIALTAAFQSILQLDQVRLDA